MIDATTITTRMESTVGRRVVLAVGSVLVIAGAMFWLLDHGTGRASDLSAGGPAPLIPPPERPPPAQASTGVVTAQPFDVRSESSPSAAASRPATGASLTVRLTWGDDHSPATGVFVHVVEWGARSGVRKTRELQSDDRGIILMTDLAPGHVGMYVDRGGGKTVTLKAGDAMTVEIEIPAGPTVAGAVVDLDGKPVGGADVWLSDYGNQTEGRVVARTDARGSFMLRCVTPMRWVAARAEGHAASGAYLIDEAKPRETVTVRLRLGGPAGVVRGTVARADGSSVEGATVRVVSLSARSVNQGAEDPPPPVVMRSGVDGTFVAASLPAGTTSVQVRSPGLAPFKQGVDVKAGETIDLKVVLGRGATVVGSVRTADGKPAAKAFVGIGSYGDFMSSSTDAGADGSFHIDSLAAGTIEIRTEVRGLGKAKASLACAEGSEVRWDAVLDPGLQIVGFVRDANDQPLVDWIVNATIMKEHGPWAGQATTNRDGRFAITNCPPQKRFHVEVLDRNAGFGAQAIKATKDDVEPSSFEHVFKIAVALGPALKGRLVDPDGKPLAAVVRATPLGGNGGASANTESASATGAFAFASLVPGTWRVVVERAPVGVHDLGELTIDAGKPRDLGDVMLRPLGTLVIDLDDAETQGPQVNYEIRPTLPPSEPHDGVRWSAWAPSLKSAHVDLPKPLSLAPGAYTVVVTGPRIEAQSLSFEVNPGQETRVRVQPNVGVPCTVRFVASPGDALPRVRWQVSAELAGGVTRSGTVDPASGGEPVAAMTLPPGAYRLHASTVTGMNVEKSFEIAPGSVRQDLEVAVPPSWPADGIPVTFRFTMPDGGKPAAIEFLVAPGRSKRPVGGGVASRTASGSFEGRGRLSAGTYIIAVVQDASRNVYPCTIDDGAKEAVVDIRLGER